MLFSQHRPDAFTGNGKRNKNYLTLMPSHPVATIGKLRDVKFDRFFAGPGRALQYQLSFKSAGG